MPDTPKQMGPYEIRGKIGHGGMGIVYRGWDSRLNRHVAIKTLWPELAREKSARERFLREARAAAALSHPNLTQIYDIGEVDGQVFFAMEYLEGQSLKEVLETQRRLSPELAVSLVRQTAAGLKSAAERGIIHRDIKPSNLVLTTDGTLKITDFGLAKHTVTDPNLTLSGQLIGTPQYIPPEQASGQESGLRGDIYSLGATLFELVTGRPVFEGPSPMSVVVKHIKEPPPSPRRYEPGTPYPLASLIQRMLAKDPGDRPQDYDALLLELDRIDARCFKHGRTIKLSTPVPTPAPADKERTTTGRSMAWWLLLAPLALGAAYFFLEGEELPSQPLTVSRSPGDAASVPSSGQTPPTPGSSGGESFLDRVTGRSRGDLSITENNSEITEDGRLRVTGRVVNNGSGRASGSKIGILLTVDSGEILGHKEVTISPSILGPGEMGRFEAFFDNPSQSVQIKLELNWFS